MAARYVWSGASGSANGSSWANAHLTLAAAITASAAGDVFYVAHDHANNYGTSTFLTFKGTSASPNRVLCVNREGSVPPVEADLTTGAAEGTNGAFTNLSISGAAYIRGMKLAPGSGQTGQCDASIGPASQVMILDTCTIALLSSGANSRIELNGGLAGRTVLLNCQLLFSSTGQGFSTVNTGQSEIIGPAGTSILASGSSVPTSLFRNATGYANLVVRGADLSALSGTLLAGANLGVVKLQASKLHASVTIGGLPTGAQQAGVELVGCSSAGNVSRNEKYQYQGTLTTETTIKRTGGASDGVTSYSWKIVPTANNEIDFPFESFDGYVWNDGTGSSKTLTVHIVTDNVTLTDADIWLEVEYLGASGAPVTSLASDASSTVLTTPANQASSSEAWTTTGLTTPIKQKLDVTFTPQMAGPVRWRVKYAKISTTVYVCPKAELS
jgi:hypothetical protein